MPKKVIVIGAGIGGIMTAALLARKGFSVDVYESLSTPGGRANTLKLGDFTFDTGPSWYLMPSVFERAFELLGTSVDKELSLKKLTPAYKVFFEDGSDLVITGDERVDQATFNQLEPGSDNKLKGYIEQGDETYRLSLQHFLYTNFTSPLAFLKSEIISKGVKMLGLSTTPLDRYVSKRFSNPKLRQILEYPMVFLGASPYKAPALYSMMSALDFKEGVFYPMGGIYTIIERLASLAQSAGVRFHYDSPVALIRTEAGHATGIELSDGSRIDADLVISNADLYHTETKLLSPASQSFPESYWKKRQAGPSALLIYLGVSGSIAELEHHTLLFASDWKKNFNAIYESKTLPHPASIYISKTSATDPSVAPKDYENIFVLVPLPAGVDLPADEAELLADKYLEQIREMTGVDLKARTVERKVYGPDYFRDELHSWQSSMLGQSHIFSQSAIFRTPNRSKKVSNLYYVGANSRPGIGLPMCLIGAELTAELVMKDFSS